MQPSFAPRRTQPCAPICSTSSRGHDHVHSSPRRHYNMSSSHISAWIASFIYQSLSLYLNQLEPNDHVVDDGSCIIFPSKGIEPKCYIHSVGFKIKTFLPRSDLLFLVESEGPGPNRGFFDGHRVPNQRYHH